MTTAAIPIALVDLHALAQLVNANAESLRQHALSTNAQILDVLVEILVAAPLVSASVEEERKEKLLPISVAT